MSNPETIEIHGLSTIHKLCKFGADHNMEGCSFTEIVERMFAELAKSQAVPEKTCSIQGHEIIINETKNELINDYDIAKEDEYLLEALVYRGVCIGKSQAVPECVWVESYDGSVFESSCGHTFELSNDGTLDDNNMKHCCFCGGKIEAQEQSHEH